MVHYYCIAEFIVGKRYVLCQQHHSDMIWTCAFFVHINVVCMRPTLLTYYYLQHKAKQSLSGHNPTPSDHMPITPRIYNVYTYFMRAFKTTPYHNIMSLLLGANILNPYLATLHQPTLHKHRPNHRIQKQEPIAGFPIK